MCSRGSTRILFSVEFVEQSSGLTERCGASEDLLKHFYALFVVTRGRHRLPPTPYAWFRNLIQSLNGGFEIQSLIERKLLSFHSYFAIQGRSLLQVWLFRHQIQPSRCHIMAPMESNFKGKVIWRNWVRHGSNGRGPPRPASVQEPLGAHAKAIGVLELSGS